MSSDLRWSLELAHMHRTGRLARPLDEYPPLAATAVLYYSTEALRNAAARARREDAWASAQEGRMGKPWVAGKRVGWHDRLTTGDPLADEWERAIARGELPDFGKERRPRG